MSDYEFTTFEEAMDAIETGVNDCISDNPDASGDDAAHDICISFFPVMEPTIRHEVAKCYLGWDPEGDADLYERHNIPRILSYG